MDFLKLIPQVFFDVIGRIVPGAFCLVCLQATTESPIFAKVMCMVVPSQELRASSLVWILVVGASAYVTGHFMAPFVRYLERPPAQSSTPARPTWLSQLSRVLRATGEAILPFRRQVAVFDPKIWRQYDWLRLERPEVGGLVARIRAEYTMYGGFAVALIAMLIVAVAIAVHTWSMFPGDIWGYLRKADARSALMKAVVAGLGAALMLRRHVDTYRTFGRSVENFYRASEGAERWKSNFL
jgi:hypothetical protein